MDLPLPDIEIVHLQRKKLTDPHARSEKNQNQGPVPDGANNGEKLTDVAWVHRPGKQIRQLQLDLSSEKCLGYTIRNRRKPRRYISLVLADVIFVPRSCSLSTKASRSSLTISSSRLLPKLV